MDESKVRSIVDANWQPMREAMCLNDYAMVFRAEALEDGVFAWSTVDPSYRTATVIIDPAKQTDEEEVLDRLRHELLHVLHAHFALYKMAVESYVRREDREALEPVYVHACERLVGDLERMLDAGLGLGPREMIALSTGRARSKKKGKL